MESALADGIDVIGMARPLILEPGLPEKLLSGEVARAADVPRRRVPRSLIALAEGSWYWAQLVRVARGREPDVRMSTWRAIATYLGYDFATAFSSGWSPRAALPAATPAE